MKLIPFSIKSLLFYAAASALTSDLAAGDQQGVFSENFNNYEATEEFPSDREGWKPVRPVNSLTTSEISEEAESRFTSIPGGKGWLFINEVGEDAGTAHGAIHELEPPATNSLQLMFDFYSPMGTVATLNPVVILKGFRSDGEVVNAFILRLGAHNHGEFGYQMLGSPSSLATIDRSYWYRVTIDIHSLPAQSVRLSLKRDDGEEDVWDSIPFDPDVVEINELIFRPSFNETGVGTLMLDNIRLQTD